MDHITLIQMLYCQYYMKDIYKLFNSYKVKKNTKMSVL